MSRLVIEPIGIHWLYDKEPTDLCAHGGLRLSVDGEVVFGALERDAWTLSTAALHLLRTLDRDYIPGEASSRQLVPCCGNMMVFDRDRGEVVNVPCPNGIDWRIERDDDMFKIQLGDGKALRVSNSVWRQAVHAFSEQVREFYFATPRSVTDQTDAEWHPYFIDEWDRRHKAAA